MSAPESSLKLRDSNPLTIVALMIIDQLAIDYFFWRELQFDERSWFCRTDPLLFCIFLANLSLYRIDNVIAPKCKLPMSTRFTELYDRFNQRIRRYVRSKVSDRQLTDDLVQEIFIKIHDHMDKLNDTDRIDGWIFRISKNKVIDYYRTQRDYLQISKWDNIPNPAVSESNDKLMQELAIDTRQFIRQLPDTYRRVIELTELEGKTNKEAAELLGLSLPAVKSRVLRGRKKLKEMFLQCCHFEFDRYGGVANCTPRRYCPDCINNEIEM